MNQSINPSSESPSNQAKDSPSNLSQTPNSDSTQTERQHPIPPPSHPMQYRAIGLVQGQYLPSADQLTQGILLASTGLKIDAVLLGRVISLVKNHIDLAKEHLWVVYPRTKQEDEHLHTQIVGVWEPETLDQDASVPPSSEVTDGYFSIRGEVIYYSREQEKVVIKVVRSPKDSSEKPKFFKLNLTGTLPDKPVGHFWDLKVQLRENHLVIEEATDIGMLPRKPKPRGNNKKPFRKPYGKYQGNPSSSSGGEKPKPKPKPKLVPRKES